MLDRRTFLTTGVAAGLGLLAASPLAGSARAAAPVSAGYAEVLEMDPLTMADASTLVVDAWGYLRDMAKAIADPSVRRVVLAILDDPAPSFLAGLGEADVREVHAELEALDMLDGQTPDDLFPPCEDPLEAPQPFRSATGSGYTGHHAYPGGNVVHTAFNVRSSLAFCDNYEAVYGFRLDRDVVVAAQMLHDLHKPWVFQWLPDGACRKERGLAGAGEHHVLSIAEALHRGLPARTCIALASAHSHPGNPKREARIAGWIGAAAVILGRDPVREGWLESAERLPQPVAMEYFVTHLGDYDWVLTVPAARWTIQLLKEIAVERYGLTESDLGGRQFNQLRNYVFAQATMMGLYQLYADQGRSPLAEAVVSIVRPGRGPDQV
jgi:hypothetical protein